MSKSTPYIVKKGDTLWELAAKYLNDPNRWPEIWHFNNEQYSAPDIKSKLKPSHYIDNPDLIFVGQHILIPVGDNRRQVIKPIKPGQGKTPAKNKVRLVPYKFELGKKLFEAYLAGGFKAKVTIKGSITIQSEKSIGWLEFNKDGFEVKVAREYETPLNQLVSEYNLGINEKTKQIDFSCGVTINAKTKYATKYLARVSIDPLSGLPKYITTITYPEIKGKLNSYFYVANGFAVEIEITKEGDIARRIPVPVPVPAPAPVTSHSSAWSYTKGILYLVGVAVVVVASAADDIFLPGPGEADDAATFALAATMTQRGLALLRGAKVLVTRVGTAAAPAGMAVSH